MTEEELIEALAGKEHAGWSSYMAYLFSKCEHNPDGSLTIPAGYVAALQIQIDTPYAELSEQEKQSDRDEVAHILPIIKDFRDTLLGGMFEAWKRKNPILAEAFCPTEKRIEQTKLSDLIPIECEVTPTEYIAHLAWDKSKSVTIQHIDALNFADEICIGLLWQNYAQEILSYIQSNRQRDRNMTEKTISGIAHS